MERYPQCELENTGGLNPDCECYPTQDQIVGRGTVHEYPRIYWKGDAARYAATLNDLYVPLVTESSDWLYENPGTGRNFVKFAAFTRIVDCSKMHDGETFLVSSALGPVTPPGSESAYDNARACWPDTYLTDDEALGINPIALDYNFDPQPVQSPPGYGDDANPRVCHQNSAGTIFTDYPGYFDYSDPLAPVAADVSMNANFEFTCRGGPDGANDPSSRLYIPPT